jgi:putative aminopeptidase FrvX
MSKETKKDHKKHLSLWKKEMQFFETLINTPSPTGFEYKGQKVWMDYIKPYVDKIETDSYGSAVAIINPDAKFKVVIEAHCDEISWFVNYVGDDGIIYVIRNGGSDHLIAPSKVVDIWTKKWPVKAVFGRPAIHTRRGGEKEATPKVENITLDVWAKSKKEVEKMGIHVGDVITYDDQFMMLNDRYCVGRALDNRAGGFMVAQVARMLHEHKKKLPFGLYIVNAVQEEIGLKGAEMMAYRINPDLAIITDVTHDTTTPMIDPKKEWLVKCGEGPTLARAPSIHNGFMDHIIDVAEKKKIPFQRAASSTYTGTDTDEFAYSRGGRPAVLISLPLRYMHTTVEMVEKIDVEHTIQLMYEVLLSLKAGDNFSYFGKKK